jgi:dihydroneopterin aldolase
MTLSKLPGRSMTDEILLEGLQFYAYHGVNPEERTQGQRFLVDVTLEANLRLAGQTDDLNRTISYSAVYKRVKATVEGEPKALVEAVAEAIAVDLLRTYTATTAVTVTVRKPEVAIKGSFLAAAGVRIRRTREHLS